MAKTVRVGERRTTCKTEFDLQGLRDQKTKFPNKTRLRAGLCDRCTVTQEVAKRRQQEFESSQMQSLQHISLLAGEMNNLKKENKRLREELRNFRAALDGSSSSTTEAKPNSSPDLSPSSGPVALISPPSSRANNQPADGNIAVKTEADQRTEESEHTKLKGMKRSHFESYKPISWKTEHSAARVGERRSQSVEGPDQRSSIPPQALLLKNSSSSTGVKVNPTRHVLHAPVPCRPQPIKSSPATLPWPMAESSEWVCGASPGSSLVVQPSLKPNLPRFPNLIPTSQHASLRRQVFGFPWLKQSIPQTSAKEPTVVFRLRSLEDHIESQTKLQEKEEVPPPKTENISGEGLREAYEGPLDLSDRGKPKSSQTPRGDSPLALQGREGGQMTPDNDGKACGSSSPSPSAPSSNSRSLNPSVKQQQEEEHTSEHKVIKVQEQKEEVNGNADQSNGKKVPVLTISLRPVVVLETLNSALQESLSSNGKSSSPAAEPGSSSDEPDEEGSVSGQESNFGCKRKRESVETETDRDSETDNAQQERKIKITEKSPT